jgi:hypothetical protein
VTTSRDKKDPPGNENPALLDPYNIPNLLRIFLYQVLNISLLLAFWSLSRDRHPIMKLLLQAILLPFWKIVLIL